MMDSQASGSVPRSPSQQLVRRTQGSIAENLPLDIFVDNLSPYLQFEDIIALRRVSKYYFHLTHEPLIWKNFLHRLRISFPPIRPTFKYSAQSSDYEIEQLVSRAISIEDNWRKKRPIVASTVTFDASLEVFDMKIINGGKYLVASIGDDHSFFINVIHLDHPSKPQTLFSYPIHGRAYQLQAKYMKYCDKPVVMIAYICRVFPEGGSANNPPPHSHMLNCIHVDLDALDLMADGQRTSLLSKTVRMLWPSMNHRLKQVVHTVRQPVKPTSQLSLYSRSRVAYVSVVQEANPGTQDYLTIVNVECPQHPWVVLCQPYVYLPDPRRQVNPLPHMKQWIKAVRHIPEQNHVFIWRTIRVDSDTGDETLVHALESFMLPDQTSGHEHRCYSSTPIFGLLVLIGNKIDSVHMTDDIWPYDEESDIYCHDKSVPPWPISVFAETSDTPVIYHWHIWPCAGSAAGDTSYAFHLHVSTVSGQMKYSTHPYTGHVIPGVYRSLIYTTEKTEGDRAPSLVSLQRYISPRLYAPANHLAHLHHRNAERHDYLGLPSTLSSTIDVGEEAVARYQAHGVGVTTWDQTIGRLCLTAGRGSVVQVVDFSYAKPPDTRFLEWKMAAPGGFERREEEEKEVEVEVEVEEKEEEKEESSMPPKKRIRIDHLD